MEAETRTIEDELDREFAEAWKPSPGDKLVGKVVDLSEREGAYGRYPIVTVQTADGEDLAIHAFHDVLRGELARLAPSLGDVIGIKYVGKHAERGYHVYRVRRLGDNFSLSWSRYADDEADEHPANVHRPLEDEGDNVPPF